MPFPYFARLSAARKRVYLRSDAAVDLPLSPGASLAPLARAIEAALVQEHRAEVEAFCLQLLDALTARFGVPAVRIEVAAVRPSGAWGELHGLYVPGERGRSPVIHVWMRTAAKKRVVAFRTFMRTVLHELCHHLDYELLGLEESFHTEGFYKRESHLFRQLLAAQSAQSALFPETVES
jgi:hypothetical protein